MWRIVLGNFWRFQFLCQVKSSLFYHTLKVRWQKVAKDYAVIYAKYTKQQYLNSNKRKLKLGNEQKIQTHTITQTMLSTEQLFHKKKDYTLLEKLSVLR